MTDNSPKSAELPLADLRRQVVDFTNSSEFLQLQSYYGRSTVFRILGVERSETAHSSFLAWLLRSEDTHGLGDFALRKLLELLVLTESQSAPNAVPRLPDNILDIIITGGYQVDDVHCWTEFALPPGSRGMVGRIDILVEFTLEFVLEGKPQRRNLRIVIENKIKAREHDDQTQRYFEWADSTASVRQGKGPCENVYVYLTPRSAVPACRHYLLIDYQALVKRILEPCRMQTIPDETGWLLDHYIRNLGQPPLAQLGDGRKELVMAMGDREFNLLQSLWDNHEPLLRAVLQAKMEDAQTDDQTRAAISTVLEGKGKDFTVYDVSWGDVPIASGVRKTDLPKICIQTAIAESACSVADFADLRANRMASFPLVRRADEIPDHQRKRYRTGPQDEVAFEGDLYFVSGNWGTGNLEPFIEFAQRIFPKLRIKPTAR